jgi:hypothetical protein
MLFSKLLGFVALGALMAGAVAQRLPPPSRTVYKCEIEGRTVYSDAPCLGAVKVDVEPTRGMNKSTGKELVGKDVRRERFEEGMGEALKPLTGMDAKQKAIFDHRLKLAPEARRECSSLDRILAAREAEETTEQQAERAAAQRLLEARVRFHALQC